MAKERLYPLLLTPIFKEKIWGGRMMENLLNKSLPAGKRIGESWELSDYRDDITRVKNGPLAGTSLHELYLGRPRDLIGREPAPGEAFPLLTKFIDSDQLLSLQVHPPDSYAKVHDSENGKTECWYVVHARPGATVVRGLAPGTTPEQFGRALETGQGLDGLLRRFEVTGGDFIFMPTGVVHAIGEGTIILEIEQNSDMTYRLSDWGRLGADGKPRPLHIRKGLEVTDFGDRSADKLEGLAIFEGGNRITHLCACRYFSVELLDLESTFREDTGGKSLVVLTQVEGSSRIGNGAEAVEAVKGDTVLVPARPGTTTVFPGRGCRILRAYVDPTHGRFIEPLLRKGFGMDEIERFIFR
jgi:mannose-6-phosphate isomerase